MNSKNKMAYKYFPRMNWLRLVPLLILLLGLGAFFYFGLYKHISFQSIKENRELLLNLVSQNPVYAALIFIFVYAILTAISAPGAALITITGGFMFGMFWGVLYTVIGATIGATTIFWAAKTALHAFLYKKVVHKLPKFASGLEKNAINYLLFLRLVPLFPFWVVNIVPAFFNVKISTFCWTTLLGILPGTIAYTWLGSGLGAIFDANQTPNLNIIFTPNILVPSLALALLALAPLIYRHYRKK
jgi:uncharacterized membrane protein YdjX (TVP38/TMEM64 family)